VVSVVTEATPAKVTVGNFVSVGQAVSVTASSATKTPRTPSLETLELIV
jgi:hypothetical protein